MCHFLCYKFCFRLTNTATNETRDILHFHYNTWPDIGVPLCPDSFLEFLHAVRNSGSLDEDVGPAIVHCSAGIGRSGTFCLVDTCLVMVSYRPVFGSSVIVPRSESFRQVAENQIEQFSPKL